MPAKPGCFGGKLRLILASGSSARQKMLRDAGVDCTAIVSAVDEDALKRHISGPPPALALALAQAKAQAVAASHQAALVIGADQLLVCGSKIFGKPADLPAAAAHLRQLSGQTHELVTAACVIQDETVLWTHVESAQLTMRTLQENFIARYLAAEGEKILGCVGAYRLEGLGAQLFDRIEGDYFTILGLSLLPLLGFLRSCGALAG